MEEKPELHELMENANVGTKWYELGIQLKLDPNRLDEIDRSRLNISRKVSDIFHLWLNSKPRATRRELVAALKKRSVNSITLADEYEKLFSKLQG